MKTLVVIMLLTLPSVAQVLSLQGGDATLQNGFGGGLIAYWANSTSSVSGGEVNGRLAFGALDTFVWKGNTVAVGQTPFGFQVQGAGGAYVMETGIEVTHESPKQSVSVFVGSTGLSVTSQFFTGGLTQHIGAGVFYRRSLSKRLTFSNLTVLNGGSHTEVAGLQLQTSKLTLTGAGGILVSSRSLNGMVSYRPIRSVTFVAAHSDAFAALNNALQRLDNSFIGTAVTAGPTSFGAGINQSTFEGKQSSGESFNAGIHVGLLSVRSGLFLSPGRPTILFHTVTARVARRFNVVATVTENLKSIQQAGSTSYGGGFSWDTNRWSLSFSQSIAFAPWLNGFAKVEVATVSFKIPHTDATFNGGFDSGSLGTKFYAGGQEYVKGPINVVGKRAETLSISERGGKYVVQGTVVDDKGQPVEGAALTLGKFDCMTDSTGHFAIRTKKTKRLTLTVVTDEFPAGNWVVVSAPSTVIPALSGEALKIVVRRK